MESSSITTTQAAARLGVTTATIRRWCEASGFGIRLMGRWRIPENRIAEIERNLVACGTGMPRIELMAQQPDVDTLLDRAMDAARQTEAA